MCRPALIDPAHRSYQARSPRHRRYRSRRICPIRVGVPSPDDQIIIAVAIDIPRRGDGVTGTITPIDAVEDEAIAAVQAGEGNQLIDIRYRDGDRLLCVSCAIGRGDDNVIDIIPTIIARRLKVGRRPKTDLACSGINREQGRIRPGQAVDQRIAIRIRRRRLIGHGLVLRYADCGGRGEDRYIAIFTRHRDGDRLLCVSCAIGRGDGDVIDIIPTIIARRLKVGRLYKTDLACIGINREQGRIRPGQAVDQSVAIRIRRRRLIGRKLVLLRIGSGGRGEDRYIVIFICHRDGDIMVRTIGAIGRGDDNVIDIIPAIIARCLKVGRLYKTDLACIGVNREQGRIRPGQAIDQSVAIRIRCSIGRNPVLRDVDPVDVPVRVIVELAPVGCAVIVVVEIGPGSVAVIIICVGLGPVDRAVRVIVEIGPVPVTVRILSVELAPVGCAVTIVVEIGPIQGVAAVRIR